MKSPLPFPNLQCVVGGGLPNPLERMSKSGRTSTGAPIGRRGRDDDELPEGTAPPPARQRKKVSHGGGSFETEVQGGNARAGSGSSSAMTPVRCWLADLPLVLLLSLPCPSSSANPRAPGRRGGWRTRTMARSCRLSSSTSSRIITSRWSLALASTSSSAGTARASPPYSQASSPLSEETQTSTPTKLAAAALDTASSATGRSLPLSRCAAMTWLGLTWLDLAALFKQSKYLLLSVVLGWRHICECEYVSQVITDSMLGSGLTCIHAYMHTCIHAYMHTCIRAYVHTCIRAYVHAHGYTRTHVRYPLYST